MRPSAPSRPLALALLGLVLGFPAAFGDEDVVPPPAPAPAPSPPPSPTPPPVEPGTDDEATDDDDDSDSAGGASGAAPGKGGRTASGRPAEPPPPKTLEQALKRLRSLREMPLRGPGSMQGRKERIVALCRGALALPEAATATGENLFRLGELAFAAEEFPRAVEAYTAYLAQKGTLADGAAAHCGRVRALARAGRTDEATTALHAAVEAHPDAPDLPFAAMATGDARILAGDPAGAAAAYRIARDCGLRSPTHTGLAAAAQSEADCLVALGRKDEAILLLKEVMASAPKLEGFQARIGLSMKRAAMVGTPFETPSLPHWTGGDPPAEASLKNRVVVWHIFAPWMDVRMGELDSWVGEVKSHPELVLIPMTRTSGWVPGSATLKAGGRPPLEEVADIAALLKKHGFQGNAGIAFGSIAFDALGVRGLPMDIVVGADGRVLFARASGEAGPALALWVARRALEGGVASKKEEPPAPASPGAPAKETPPR